MKYSASVIKIAEIYTNNPVELSLGHTVWLVSGEGMGSKKSFYLASAFRAETCEVGTYKRTGFKNSVAGTGEIYGLTIQLDWDKCFTDYMNRTQFQSRGLHAIDDHDPVIEQFLTRSGYCL